MRVRYGDTIVLGGLLGGLAVGVCDGIQAGVRAGIDLRSLPAAALLAGSVDLVMGVVLGVFVLVVVQMARWGWHRRYTRTANLVAMGAAGLGAAVAAVAVLLISDRHPQRFNAAVWVALAAGLAGTVGALVGPAVARLLSPTILKLREDEATVLHKVHFGAETTPAGLFVLAPAMTVALMSIIFLVAWKTRASPKIWLQAIRVSYCAFVALLIPSAINYAAGKGRRIPRTVAMLVAPAVLGVPLALFIRTSWTPHLKVLPWRDIRVVLLVILAGGMAAVLLRARRMARLRRPGGARPGGPGTPALAVPWSRRLALTAVMVLSPPAAAGAALLVGESEAARKSMAAHGGMVWPMVKLVRPAFDRDRDGFARRLGGGDCNDRDPAINPAARDWPEDRVDQDCDGQDPTLAELVPPPAPPVPEGIPEDLHILLVVISNLRADHLGCYGSKRNTSPEIDQLAAEGVVFENAWAHNPTSKLSIPAILTSRWPSAIDWSCSASRPGLATGQKTIAEVLRGKGYMTAAFHARDELRRLATRGYDRGVQFYDDRRSALHKPSAPGAGPGGSSARELADDVLDFLKAYGDGEAKLFLTVTFVDPDPSHERQPQAPDFGGEPADLYDSEIWYTDKQLGRIIAGLRARGLYEKTVVVVTGDHGESFDEPVPGIPAEVDLSAAQTKVPLVVRVPGVLPRRVKAPVGHVDIAPSLVSVARAEPPGTFLGRSLVDVMAGVNDGRHPPPDRVFQEAILAQEGPLEGRAIERHGVATAGNHLIWRRSPENTVACYDVAVDPIERRDLWATRAGERVCTALNLALRRRFSLLKFAEPPPQMTFERTASERAAALNVPAPQFPRRARFGSAIDLLGYDVAPAQEDPQDVHLSPCGKLEVSVHIETPKPLVGWEMFFEIEGPPASGREGERWRKVFNVPGDRWLMGQRMRDRFAIGAHARQPSGAYTLYLGFGKPPTVEDRLPVSPREAQEARNRFRLLSFTVD